MGFPATGAVEVKHRRMRSFSLKKRIILPLIAAGVAVFLIGADFMNHLQEHQKQDAVLQAARAMDSHIKSAVEQKARMMVAMLHFITSDHALVSALESGDRKQMLAFAAPIYRRLNRENNITHFYFHDAHRINLLRVHKPEKYGDTINRFTILGAEKTGKPFSGLELGPLGTFTLRSVMPVFDRGRLVGYLELGQEIDDLLQHSGKMFGVELFMLIDKRYLAQSAWEEGMRMLGRPFGWNDLHSTVLVSRSMDDVPLDYLEGIGDSQTNTAIRTGKNIDWHGLTYWAGIIPIDDAGGRPVATLVLLRDMTVLIGKARTELLSFTGISSAMALAILILLYVILGRTENELTVARQDLIDEGKARENMQASFIRQLQEEQNKLVKSEEATRLLLNAVGEGIYGVDMQGNTTFVNPAACRMLGYEEGELISRSMHAAVHHSYPDGTPYPEEKCQMYKAMADARIHHVSDEVLWHKDGSSFPVEYISTPIIEGGTVAGAVVVFSDITERKKAQEAIEQALNIQRVLDTMLNISLPPLTLKEVLGKSLDAILSIPAFALLNKGAVFLVEQEEQVLELVVQRNLPDTLLESCGMLPFGKCLCGRAAASREIVYVNHLDERHEIKYDGIQPHGHYCIPIMLGSRLLGVLNIYVAAGHVAEENEQQALKTVADTLAVVIERKQAEEELQQLAHNDILTGLPNRTLFYDRMGQALAITQRHKQKFAVLFLDLDHFKEINDTLGHDMGDVLLKEAANRLLGCVRRMDTVARMGGDEFTVILTETRVPENVELVARHILKALSQPFELAGKPREIGCSIGIAIYPEDGRDSETLLKHADVAMYNAKRKRNTYCFYNNDLQDDA